VTTTSDGHCLRADRKRRRPGAAATGERQRSWAAPPARTGRIASSAWISGLSEAGRLELQPADPADRCGVEALLVAILDQRQYGERVVDASMPELGRRGAHPEQVVVVASARRKL
jgi:hypothetical protein